MLHIAHCCRMCLRPSHQRPRSRRWNSRCVRTPPAQLQVTVAAPPPHSYCSAQSHWCRRPRPSRRGTTTGHVISAALLRRTYASTSRKSIYRGISAQRQLAVRKAIGQMPTGEHGWVLPTGEAPSGVCLTCWFLGQLSDCCTGGSA